VTEQVRNPPGLNRVFNAALERRHLTKGQQAILLAMAHPEPKRGVHSELGGLTWEFSKERLSLGPVSGALAERPHTGRGHCLSSALLGIT
jgi:hypothetical protein